MGSVIDKISNIGRTSSADAAATAARDAAAHAGLSAQAQEEELKKLVGMGERGLGQAMGDAKQIARLASPDQLMQFDRALQGQQKQLNRQAELFASIDPAIMEASQQALKLMRGEEARTLAPIRNQRDRQRQKLLDNLRAQLGPGAETSTAGIQALNAFDAETDTLLANQQQSSLAQLFGMAQSGAVNRSAMNQGYGNLANIAGQRATTGAGVLGQAAALRQGGFANLMNAQSQRAGGAGSQFVSGQLEAQGRLAQAQSEQAFNQGLVTTIVGAGAQAAFSGGGGTPTPVNKKLGDGQS